MNAISSFVASAVVALLRLSLVQYGTHVCMVTRQLSVVAKAAQSTHASRGAEHLSRQQLSIEHRMDDILAP